MTSTAAIRDVVTVAGPDARRYLHSQVAQDVDALAAGDGAWTLVLAPNGRVEVLARIQRLADERFELDTEAGFGDVLARRLDRFKIRVDAEVFVESRDLTGAQVVGWWGGDEWGVGPEYETARVAAGWPAMGTEIAPGERIPAEVGVVEAAVSFTKGCYPGQELVERMHSRGSQAPNQLRVVTVAQGASAGDPIVDPADPDGKPVGTLTSVAGGRALGYVRRGSTVGEIPGPPLQQTS